MNKFVMFKKHTVLLLIFAFHNGFRTTDAQFEDLEACLTQTDFFAQFGSCLVTSIIEGIDPRSMAPLESTYDVGSTGRAGRRLQSLESDLTLSAGAKKYYIDMKMEQAGLKQNKIFDDMKKLGKLWSIGQRDETLSQKIKAFNLKQLVGDHYMVILNQHLGEIFEAVGELKHYEADMQGRARNNDVLDDVQAQDTKRLQDILACLWAYPDAAFEDNLDWLQCLVSCDDLGPLWNCTTDVMKSMGEPCSNVVWFSDAVVALTSSFLNKSICDFVVEEPSGSLVRLTEGGPQEIVTIRSYLPPGVLCIGPDPLGDPIQLGLAVVGNIFGFNITCDVELQLTTSNWIDNILPYAGTGLNLVRPKCRVPNRTLRQVAIGFHDAAVNNSGIFKITDENWNSPFEIPLLPVVDHRVDGDVTVSFTTKMFVQNEMRGNTVKLDVEVVDTDVGSNSASPGAVECYSVNDPHIMTFDGHYYNNFYQGAFYLYKHDEYPYEVQAIFQPCQRGNNNGTCNCAVAVRSGDDVFVMDRCRRCVDDVCDVELFSVLYTNAALTSGTRVFHMDGGLRHDVVLPHGTIVKIVASNDLLNVWITPGSYDQNNTMGLCGTFNEDPKDDLTMPNGSVYVGPGDDVLQQPHDFNQAWRVPENELIFYGALPLNKSFVPLDTCTCNHILMSGAQCDCGRGSMTELCDLFMENEYTEDNISSIIYPSRNNGSVPNYLSTIDLDESHIPSDLAGWYGVWNDTAARDFCTNLIQTSTNPIIQDCLTRNSSVIDHHVIEFCVQDIQILDNTNWQYAAIDNAVFRCFNELVRSVMTRAGDIGMFPNSSCVNQCNNNGICDNGLCSCNEGFSGADCLTVGHPQPYLSSKDTQICDNRQQLCHFATIFGQNFPDDGTMVCQIKNVEISPEGVDYLPKRYTVVTEEIMEVISSNQAVCPIPGNGSYEVYTVWDGEPATSSMWNSVLPQSLLGSSHQRMKRGASGVTNMKMAADEVESVDVRFIFISYDSVCYTCDAATQSCTKKTSADHCWINSTCWAPGETKSNDTCRFCSPQTDMTDWTMSDATQACVDQLAEEEKEAEDNKHDMMIRGAVGGSISFLVVIVVIIMFCLARKKEKAVAEAAEEERLRNPVEPKKGTVFFDDGHGGYDNPEKIVDDAFSYDVIRHSSFGGSSVGGPSKVSKTRVEILRNEERPFDSQSITSTDSITYKTAL